MAKVGDLLKVGSTENWRRLVAAVWIWLECFSKVYVQEASFPHVGALRWGLVHGNITSERTNEGLLGP